MTQVEHKWAAAERPAQLRDRSFKGGAARNQQHRIEIALNRGEPLKARAGIAGRHHRIETDTIDPGLCDVPLVEQTRPTGKTNDRMVGKPLFYRRNDASGGFDHQTPERRLGQNACPTVEKLHDLGTGLDLSTQKVDGAFDEQLDQRAEALDVAISPA